MTFDFRPTKGAARERVSDQELEEARSSILADDRRRRSLFFDGRFLAARDLTRDQAYFLARQADLGVALGSGVVTGLRVTSDGSGSRLLVSPGHGITPAGELVVVRDVAGPSEPPAALVADLNDTPTIERLDASFGLSREPRAPARNRTGTFVVALRPVEYTANPIAQYPTSLQDRKTEPLRDGDIIEAVALSLIPFDVDPEGSGTDTRARAAQAVFLRGAAATTPVDALPLAMVGLNRGVIDWVDEWLVRREIADEPFGFGLMPRTVRAAFVRCYLQHLDDVVALRARTGQPPTFAASQHFLALPPAGRVPVSAVVARSGVLEQTYFPPEIEVDLSIVPRDELPALLEDSLTLPPIDLTAPAEALESVQVSILIPVTREEVGPLKRELNELRLRLHNDPAARLLRQRPLLALRSLQRIREPEPETTDDLVLEAWVGQLERSHGGALWYVRRRNLPNAAQPVPRERPPMTLIGELGAELARPSQEGEGFRQVLQRTSSQKGLEILKFVIQKQPAFAEPLIFSGFVAEALKAGTVNTSVRTRYEHVALGTGVRKLTAEAPALNQLATRQVIAALEVVPELDALARPATAQVSLIASRLIAFVQEGNTAGLKAAVLSGSIAV